MKFIDYYYLIKPVIPRRLQIAVRRAIASYKRKQIEHIWPISPESAKVPIGWRGWPENKKFALFLRHDVDTGRGLKNCLQLMNIDKELNFRSSFNFVVEDYRVPLSLRQHLVDSGFEVGIHGLKHDGKLFISRRVFEVRAQKINNYLKKWGSVGFASPSMLRNHEWMTDLDIEYACSTFDTDPFEPQSEGMHTIFPFFVTSDVTNRTFIELPYTLPQDHGLFIIQKEKDNTIWREKLDWIAQNGGMAFLNTHPDYMNFEKTPCSFEQYPVNFYIDLLEYIKTNYAGQYWHALPRELARFWKSSMLESSNLASPKAQEAIIKIRGYRLPQNRIASTHGIKIWIDLENTPHVPFFIPVIRELERRGHQVVLTARDAFQVCELADEKGLRYTQIGQHYGKNPIKKILGLLWRSLKLLPFALSQKPALALSHGARSQILLCNFMRIPTVVFSDYEHSKSAPMACPKWFIVPDALFAHKFPLKKNRLRFFHGIKEDVYVPDFRPDPSLPKELGFGLDETIIVVRPPANEAHYYNPESDILFIELMSRILQTPRIRVVLLPRHHIQEEALRADYPEWFKNGKTVVPSRAMDGLDLIWLSDLVVSGGGTMNREAAALGVPVYSIFRGKTGGVDRKLEQEGRLTLIRSAEEVWTKILFTHRDKSYLPNNKPRPALEDIINYIEEIIQKERLRPR